ncbi:MAG TPA: nucleotidyltransferase domain-containing protein [Planctomycetaceae bacterium]|nr:nucleotidyltransferase domain-containing protein [Planctomycetaceae bacterium]HQZ65729.1 nucleotidyltransferase domain-containing protein [Planctomycetaceae bacterium]
MSTLSLLLSSGVRAELFRLLFGLNSTELHVRELERQSGFAVSTVRQELKKLDSLGLVQTRVSGNRSYYQANSSHPLFPEIRSLVLKTNGLADVLREALGTESVRMAFVFGSVAEGSETAESDIDLMVIGSISLRTLAGKLSGVPQIVGRELNPSVMTEAEFSKRRQAKDHFVSTVLAAPKLFVIGDADELEAVGK